MNRLLWGLLLLPLLNTQTFAQDKNGSGPLTLSVRPSGYDNISDEARARQERLAKQMEENDFKFRSICMECGDRWKHNAYAPFDPQKALSPGKRASVE